MVFDKVKAILVDQLDVDENKVTMEASITDDLGAEMCIRDRYSGDCGQKSECAA